jgi:hypothetical protein
LKIRGEKGQYYNWKKRKYKKEGGEIVKEEADNN